MMVIKRGVDGRLKIEPALRYWASGIGLISALVAGGVYTVVGWIEKVEHCEARGGQWIGGMMRDAYCEVEETSSDDW